MVGRTRRWCHLALLLSGILTFVESKGTICRKPVLSHDTTLVPLLSNVTLTCPGCEGQVSWIRHSPQISPEPLEGVLRDVTYRDEGNYTCYREGAAACTTQLLVKDALEKPQIACYMRYHTHNVTCEWRPSHSQSPHTTVSLISWSITGDHTVTACSYHSSAATFTCSLPHEEGYSERHTLTLCATSRTDSQSSRALVTSVSELLQPEPPINVTVTPVENEPRKLRVSWSPITLWQGTYYKLLYEVQYRVENSQHVSNITNERMTEIVLTDILKGRRYRVRVRARDDFYESWGPWSEEVLGVPWSDEKAGTATTMAPSTTYSVTLSEDEDPGNNNTSVVTTMYVQRYPWLLVGLSVILVILFFMLLLIRQYDRKVQSLKERLLRTLFHSKSKVPGTQPLKSEGVPLSRSPSTTVTVTAKTMPGAD